MTGHLHEVRIEAVKANLVQMIEKEWFLLATGTREKANAMTANWGGFGYLWNREIVFCFVRPERYTFELLEENRFFTMNFFDPAFKPALDYFGTVSGREQNKITKHPELEPKYSELGNLFFDSAKLVLECRKIYAHPLAADSILEEDVRSFYQEQNLHVQYIGEILRCMSRS